jgi:hypothetical protein
MAARVAATLLFVVALIRFAPSGRFPTLIMFILARPCITMLVFMLSLALFASLALRSVTPLAL